VRIIVTYIQVLWFVMFSGTLIATLVVAMFESAMLQENVHATLLVVNLEFTVISDISRNMYSATTSSQHKVHNAFI
jgi:hypothetical protein